MVAAGWTASKQGYITSTRDGETYSDPIQIWQVTGLTARSNKDKIRVEYKSLGSGYRYKIYFATSKNGKYTAVTNTALTKKNITTYLNKALGSGSAAGRPGSLRILAERISANNLIVCNTAL